jgi:hypothetical protein
MFGLGKMTLKLISEMKIFLILFLIISSLAPNFALAEEISDIVEEVSSDDKKKTGEKPEDFDEDEEVSNVYKQHIEKRVFKETEDPLSGFTFSELVELSKTAKPDGLLKEKLDLHLSMTFVVNRKFDEKLSKPFIRISEWNVERGFQLDEVKDIFANPKKYEERNISKVARRHINDFKDELSNLTSSDIVCLNELDIGMPRTKYNDSLTDFTDNIGWNYAYATEFVEVGPVFQMLDIDIDKYIIEKLFNKE